MSKTLIRKIFSINTIEAHKIITFLGFKIKIKLAPEASSINLKIDNIISKLDKQQKKSALLITHELSETGAPIVLIPIVKFLLKQNIHIVILSMKDGALNNFYSKLGIDVIILNASLNKKIKFAKFVSKFDIIFCNTIVTKPFVDVLINLKKNFAWWIHEGKFAKEYIAAKPSTIRTLNKTKLLYTVSEYSKKYIEKYNKNVQIFRYGIEDKNNTNTLTKTSNDNQLHIAMIGSVDPRKNAGYLIEAYTELPNEYKNRIIIDIIGNDQNEYAFTLKEKYKAEKNIKFHGPVPYEKMNDKYRNIDVLFSVSLDDSLPVVVTEAFINKIPVCLSNNVGQYKYINDYVNGFKIKLDNPDDLKAKLIWIVDNQEKLEEIGKQGRKIYQDYLRMEIFENNFSKILSNFN